MGNVIDSDLGSYTQTATLLSACFMKSNECTAWKKNDYQESQAAEAALDVAVALKEAPGGESVDVADGGQD